MSRCRRILIATVWLLTSTSLVACRRAGESDTAKETEKAAKDFGHATVDLADKAGKSLEDATHQAGAAGQEAWITAKVKTELTRAGFDVLHLHVDTEGKVVTLSGTIESKTAAQKAVSVAKAVEG